MQGDDGFARSGRTGNAGRAAVRPLHSCPLHGVQKDGPFLPRIGQRSLQLLHVGEHAKATLRKLILQWFGIANLEQVSKDTTVYPLFTPELRTAMAAESERFIDAVLWERDGSLATLLSSPSTFVDSALAKVYGVSDPGGSTLVERDLDPQQRAGLLTHASVMAVYSHPGDSFPIARGKFIRKNLLC